MDGLKNGLVAWHFTWLHENVVLMYGSNKNPIFLMVSMGPKVVALYV